MKATRVRKKRYNKDSPRFKPQKLFSMRRIWVGISLLIALSMILSLVAPLLLPTSPGSSV